MSTTRGGDGDSPLEDVAAVEALLERLDAVDDPVLKELATDTVAAVLRLHGAGLARVLDAAGRLGPPELLAALVDDELVGHLLLLHDLHPVDVADRVATAVAGVRPALAARHAEVSLESVADGVAHVRLSTTSGCGSTAASLTGAVEEAVLDAAPELSAVDVTVDVARAPTVIPVSALKVRSA
jgi:Fe-S cluster biogenesis protein NfuA